MSLRRPFSFFAATAALLALAATPALCTDGTVLINQATASTGLPGCAANSTALVTICKPGSYRLSGNLMVPAGVDGVAITASNVTLDLNGFSISHSGSFTVGAGVSIGQSYISEADNVTVIHGSVQGFNTGLNVWSTAATLDGLTVLDNSVGVWVNGDVKIEECQLKRNYEAVSMTDTGGGSSVTNSLVANNQGYGLLNLFGDGRWVYSRNVLLGNGTDVSGGISMGDNMCTSGKC